MAGASRFEDLVAWQRMHDLNIKIWYATTHAPARDFAFRNQIRDAADSAARNVAEGFGRFNPGDCARFLDMSRASALETKALLKKGLAIGYWSEDEFGRLDTLADRGIQAVATFQRYLRSSHVKRNAARRYTRSRQNDPNDPLTRQPRVEE